MNAMAPLEECLDMIIVGAGISGIGMAVHMVRDCPNKSFAILDRRDAVGGGRGAGTAGKPGAAAS